MNHKRKKAELGITHVRSSRYSNESGVYDYDAYGRLDQSCHDHTCASGEIRTGCLDHHYGVRRIILALGSAYLRIINKIGNRSITQALDESAGRGFRLLVMSMSGLYFSPLPSIP